MEILSQEEICQLLDAINAGGGTNNGFESIDAFEKYLTTRKIQPEKPYGIFDNDVSICRFFDSQNNDNSMADLTEKNEE
jgi:hypothetical protein